MIKKVYNWPLITLSGFNNKKIVPVHKGNVFFFV